MDNNDTWYSPPFYSHLGGYKMHLRVKPRQANLLTGINLSVCLMKGEFDDLSWPVGTLTLQQPTRKQDFDLRNL